MSDTTTQTSLVIGKKAFLTSFFILLVLMIAAGVLTLTVAPGMYERVSENGRELVVPGTFRHVDRPDYPAWRWITSPVEVLFSSDSIVVFTIIIFLLVVGGAFPMLEKAGVIKTILSGIVRRFAARKYLLMAIVMLFFMFCASVLGIYEGLVPLVVFIVPLAHILGWDSLTGLGMSLLAIAFGFAAAITNPFTIGVAQQIAGLPMFSGAWLRIPLFLLVYVSVFLFVRAYAKRVEKDPAASLVYREDLPLKNRYTPETMFHAEGTELTPGMKRATVWFSVWMGIAVLFILTASLFPAVSFLAFPLMGLMFFFAGTGSALLSGLSVRRTAGMFFSGAMLMLPGVVLILMAMSVKVIITNGMIMDTILNSASQYISRTPAYVAAILIYLLTLVMEFFIGSASAKAFLMMPILSPLADLVGVTRQTAVLAFDFGDGFSNMLYPSNALLLIALGFTVVSYPKWLRWTLPLQGLMVVFTLVFLAIAVAVGYGPF